MGEQGFCNIGGATAVSEVVKARCLNRMQCWFRLAMDVCEAEWPYYEAVSACSVFNLADDGRSAPWFADGADHETQQINGLERLSRIFGCQQDLVDSQYRRRSPVARREVLECGGSNLQAWRRALGRTENTMCGQCGRAAS